MKSQPNRDYVSNDDVQTPRCRALAAGLDGRHQTEQITMRILSAADIDAIEQSVSALRGHLRTAHNKIRQLTQENEQLRKDRDYWANQWSGLSREFDGSPEEEEE